MSTTRFRKSLESTFVDLVRHVVPTSSSDNLKEIHTLFEKVLHPTHYLEPDPTGRSILDKLHGLIEKVEEHGYSKHATLLLSLLDKIEKHDNKAELFRYLTVVLDLTGNLLHTSLEIENDTFSLPFTTESMQTDNRDTKIIMEDDEDINEWHKEFYQANNDSDDASTTDTEDSIDTEDKNEKEKTSTKAHLLPISPLSPYEQVQQPKVNTYTTNTTIYEWWKLPVHDISIKLLEFTCIKSVLFTLLGYKEENHILTSLTSNTMCPFFAYLLMNLSGPNTEGIASILRTWSPYCIEYSLSEDVEIFLARYAKLPNTSTSSSLSEDIHVQYCCSLFSLLKQLLPIINTLSFLNFISSKVLGIQTEEIVNTDDVVAHLVSRDIGRSGDLSKLLIAAIFRYEHEKTSKSTCQCTYVSNMSVPSLPLFGASIHAFATLIKEMVYSIRSKVAHVMEQVENDNRINHFSSKNTFSLVQLAVYLDTVHNKCKLYQDIAKEIFIPTSKKDATIQILNLKILPLFKSIGSNLSTTASHTVIETVANILLAPVVNVANFIGLISIAAMTEVNAEQESLQTDVHEYSMLHLWNTCGCIYTKQLDAFALGLESKTDIEIPFFSLQKCTFIAKEFTTWLLNYENKTSIENNKKKCILQTIIPKTINEYTLPWILPGPIAFETLNDIDTIFADSLNNPLSTINMQLKENEVTGLFLIEQGIPVPFNRHKDLFWICARLRLRRTQLALTDAFIYTAITKPSSSFHSLLHQVLQNSTSEKPYPYLPGGKNLLFNILIGKSIQLTIEDAISLLSGTKSMNVSSRAESRAKLFMSSIGENSLITNCFFDSNKDFLHTRIQSMERNLFTYNKSSNILNKQISNAITVPSITQSSSTSIGNKNDTHDVNAILFSNNLNDHEFNSSTMLSNVESTSEKLSTPKLSKSLLFTADATARTTQILSFSDDTQSFNPISTNTNTVRTKMVFGRGMPMPGMKRSAWWDIDAQVDVKKDKPMIKSRKSRKSSKRTTRNNTMRRTIDPLDVIAEAEDESEESIESENEKVALDNEVPTIDADRTNVHEKNETMDIINHQNESMDLRNLQDETINVESLMPSQQEENNISIIKDNVHEIATDTNDILASVPEFSIDTENVSIPSINPFVEVHANENHRNEHVQHDDLVEKPISIVERIDTEMLTLLGEPLQYKCDTIENTKEGKVNFAFSTLNSISRLLTEYKLTSRSLLLAIFTDLRFLDQLWSIRAILLGEQSATISFFTRRIFAALEAEEDAKVTMFQFSNDVDEISSLNDASVMRSGTTLTRWLRYALTIPGPHLPSITTLQQTTEFTDLLSTSTSTPSYIGVLDPMTFSVEDLQNAGATSTQFLSNQIKIVFHPLSPLQNVLWSPTLATAYQRVFGTLLRLEYSAWGLENLVMRARQTLRKYHTISIIGQKFPCIVSILNNCHTLSCLTAAVLHALAPLRNHAATSATGSPWVRLLQAIRKATSIEEIYMAHCSYVTSIERALLTSRTNATAGYRLKRLLDIADSFVSTCRIYYKGFMSVIDRIYHILQQQDRKPTIANVSSFVFSNEFMEYITNLSTPFPILFTRASTLADEFIRKMATSMHVAKEHASVRIASEGIRNPDIDISLLEIAEALDSNGFYESKIIVSSKN